MIQTETMIGRTKGLTMTTNNQMNPISDQGREAFEEDVTDVIHGVLDGKYPVCEAVSNILRAQEKCVEILNAELLSVKTREMLAYSSYQAASKQLSAALSQATGQAEPVGVFPIGLDAWGGQSRFHSYKMSDGSIQVLKDEEAKHLRELFAPEIAAYAAAKYTPAPAQDSDRMREALVDEIFNLACTYASIVQINHPHNRKTIDRSADNLKLRIREVLSSIPQQVAGSEIRCPICNGNDGDMPCAYTTEKLEGCLRVKRLFGKPAEPTSKYSDIISDGGFDPRDRKQDEPDHIRDATEMVPAEPSEKVLPGPVLITGGGVYSVLVGGKEIARWPHSYKDNAQNFLEGCNAYRSALLSTPAQPSNEKVCDELERLAGDFSEIEETWITKNGAAAFILARVSAIRAAPKEQGNE